MVSLHFYVLSMKKNQDRRNNISKMLNKFNINYTIVEAIDGNDLVNNIDCKQILKPKPELFGQTFKCIENNEEWIYDGTILKSLPGYKLNGHFGTKGLTLSNIKTFMLSQTIKSDWICILEDDAEINKYIIYNLHVLINNPKNVNYDIVLLDDRHYGWGGTSGVLYNKKIIPTLLKDLHPLSHFSIINETRYGLANLWDWKLYKYICHHNKNIKFKNFPCIKSGNFPSTISL